MRTRLPSRAKIGAAQLCKSKAIVAVVLLAALMACGGGSPGSDEATAPVAQEEAATSAPASPTPLPTPSASPHPLPATPFAPIEPTTPAPLTELSVEPAFPALSLSRMVGMTYPPDGSDRLYVVLQPGRIVFFPNDREVDSAELFLDIRDRVNDRGEEEGLLGLAFDPQYADNGHLYVYYSASSPRRSVVSRFSVSADGRADPGSERVLLEVAQPFSNHNGGQIAFGPDGYLYIALGDGGSRGDPQENGQDLGTLLGSILRIDVSTVDSTGAYAVPSDNPFVGHSGARPEIWAYGLRNPWRFSFDRATGDLWTADVGQNRFEEVDIIRPGLNYGWNIMEGEECFARSDCDRTGLEIPVAEYGREDGCSVTGGYVYRGSSLPSLYGAYVYGDYCSGRIWALRHDGDEVTEHMQIVDSGLRIPSFAEDAAGELYVLSFDGTIYRLVAP